MTPSAASESVAASHGEVSAASSVTRSVDSSAPDDQLTRSTSKQDPPPTSLHSQASSSSSKPPGPQRPPNLGPPPKKRKSMLSAKGSATTSAGKPTKLNTLEKSKLDWESYKKNEHPTNKSTSPSQPQTQAEAGTEVLTAEERAEMESQTRAGGSARAGKMSGFLDRADFLDRVSERMEAAAEDEKRKVVAARREQ